MLACRIDAAGQLVAHTNSQPRCEVQTEQPEIFLQVLRWGGAEFAGCAGGRPCLSHALLSLHQSCSSRYTIKGLPVQVCSITLRAWQAYPYDRSAPHYPTHSGPDGVCRIYCGRDGRREPGSECRRRRFGRDVCLPDHWRSHSMGRSNDSEGTPRCVWKTKAHTPVDVVNVK